MVRHCLVEDKVSVYIASLLHRRVAAEAGLIIGHSGTSRDFIFFLVETPAQDGAETVRIRTKAPVPGKKQLKGISTGEDVEVTIDTEWLSEHAAQVAKLLPGGISVLGFYLVTSDAGYQSAAPQLCRLVATLGAALTPAIAAGNPSPATSPLLLHICATTGKLSLKERPEGASTAAGLRPVETKFGPGLNNFQAVACRYTLDWSVPLPQGKDTLAAACERLLESEICRMEAAVVAVGDVPLSSSQTVAEALSTAAPDCQLAQLTLFCSPATPRAAGDTALGTLRLQGTLHGRAYVHRRDNASAAAVLLKADLAASLRCRMEAMCEEAEARGDQQEHPLLSLLPVDAVVMPSMPVRVFMPTTAGITVCEYLVEGDERADVVARARELLGGHVAEDTVIVTGEGLKRPSPPAIPWDALRAPEIEKAKSRHIESPSKPKSCLWVVTVWMMAGSLLAVFGVVTSNTMMRYLEENDYLV